MFYFSKRYLAFAFTLLLALCSLAESNSIVTLEKLVEFGILTDSEAKYVAKESVGVVQSARDESSIRITGFAHLRYQYLAYDYADSNLSLDKGFFALRRIVPVAMADITDDSRVMFTFYLPSSAMINTARYEYDVDGEFLCGSLWFGHEPAFFCMEEPESGSRIKTPDRSIINMYFGGGDHGFSGRDVNYFKTPAAFSGYHTGVYWNGYLPKNKSIIYRLAFTNSKPEKIYYEICNGYSVWSSIGVDEKNEDYYLRAGVNAGYSSRVVSAVSGGALPCSVGAYGDGFGVNPYFWLEYGRFTIQTEFVASSIQYGSTLNDDTPIYSVNSPSATPWGFYALIGYKIPITPFGDFEPVVRFTHLDSDGRGIDENVMYKAGTNTGLYDKVDSLYMGANWYFMGNTLKYQMGVELAKFSGAPASRQHKSGKLAMVVMQVQIIF